MPKPTEKSPHTIAFRMPDVAWTELAERARVAGVSVHEHARSMVLQSLEASDLNDVLAGISQIKTTQRRLLRALSKSVEAILLNTTDLEPEEIRAWTRTTLTGRSKGSES